MKIIKWEYSVKQITRNNPKELEESLNKMGALGWDLGTSITLHPENMKMEITVLIFKRPLTYLDNSVRL